MEKSSGKPGLGRQKIAVADSGLLVPIGKSSKLMAMRDKHRQVQDAKNTRLSTDEDLPDLKPEVAKELTQARRLIDDRINAIMKGFPDAKKNKLFSFKYGSVEVVKALTIAAAFKLLGVDGRALKMHLIADKDYYGKDARRSQDDA